MIFKCIFVGYAHENAKSRSIKKAFRASEKFGMSHSSFERMAHAKERSGSVMTRLSDYGEIQDDSYFYGIS